MKASPTKGSHIRNTLCLLLALLFISVSAIAEESQPKPSGEDLVKAALSVPMTRKNILLMCALSGATTEDLRTIDNDINAKDFNQNVPTLEIKKNELFVNNRPSGLIYKSYSPVKIEANYRTWTYDKTKSIGDNYLAFHKFVKGLGKKAARLNMFTSEAFAQTRGEIFEDDVVHGFYKGIAAGIVAGGVISFIGAGPFGVPAGVAIGAVTGAGLGTVGGTLRGVGDSLIWAKTGVARKELVDVLLRGDLKLTCAPHEMTITPADPKSRLSVVVAPKELKLTDLDGRNATSSITPAQKSVLNFLQKNCGNANDASKIIGMLSSGAKTVIAAIQKGQGTTNSALPAVK